MALHTVGRLVVVSMCLLGATAIVEAAPESATTDSQLLSGDRVLLGTVEEVRSDQARINTGEMQPRFVPMNVRKDKKLLELKKGDLVEITVNDQNLLVDVHLAGEMSHHRIVHGHIAQPMETGHDKAVIRTKDGKEESHLIRPVARSKVASIPVGADAIFLIDELDKIADVTFGSAEAAHHAGGMSQQKSPLKGNLNRIAGVIQTPLNNNTIVIRADDGKESSYEVRPMIQQRVASLAKGDAAVLLVDDENKVTDVSFVPREK